MRRWNGWGDESVDYPLSAAGLDYLRAKLGELAPSPDVPFAGLLAGIPDTAFGTHSLIDTSPQSRLLHARGQSLPDWIALRYGRLPAAPDGVAYPEDEAALTSLFDYAAKKGAHLIPYGGGTSVVGGVNALPSTAPLLTIDLRKVNELEDFDEVSRLATFGAGAIGPEIESRLNAHGYTLGHFPQSWEYSTLGGWVATRSSGQQSLLYGHIDDLFAGGRVVSPCGLLALPPFPSSAAGPDLRELVLGSEGRLGVITQVTVRVRPLPETELFYGAFFRDWESGVCAVQEVVQSGLPLSMLRLSGPLESESTLVLAGKESLVAWADRGLCMLRFGDGRCLLVYAFTGDERSVSRSRREVNALLRSHGGLPTGTLIGEIWRRSRFKAPYLRNTLWEHGIAVDTVETAAVWSKVISTAAAMEASLRAAASGFGERIHVFTHLSHLYQDGASLYTTYLFRRTADPDELLERWKTMKSAVSEAIQASGGTISHHHGVGRDHLPYLPAEIGPLGMDLLESARLALDPDGLLNPGVLLLENR